MIFNLNKQLHFRFRKVWNATAIFSDEAKGPCFGPNLGAYNQPFNEDD